MSKNTNKPIIEQQDLLTQINNLEQYLNQSQSISSIKQPINKQYYTLNKWKKQAYNSNNQQDLILIPQSKILKLLQTVQKMKKTLKSQTSKFDDQIQNLRNGVRAGQNQKLLMHRQKVYLQDMVRGSSEPNFVGVRSTPNFYTSRFGQRGH